MSEFHCWVIYDHPKDYPNHYVVREQWVQVTPSDPPGSVGEAELLRALEAQVADTLEEARKLVPPGLHNLGRMPDDDPVIAEVWI